MNIIKGNIYKGGTGVLVEATENSPHNYFEGIVVKADEHNSYKVGYKSDGWNKTNFRLYSTPFQVEKNKVKTDLIKSIELIFSNEDNTCENLNEVRDYITNLMSQ